MKNYFNKEFQKESSRIPVITIYLQEFRFCNPDAINYLLSKYETNFHDLYCK